MWIYLFAWSSFRPVPFPAPVITCRHLKYFFATPQIKNTPWVQGVQQSVCWKRCSLLILKIKHEISWNPWIDPWLTYLWNMQHAACSTHPHQKSLHWHTLQTKLMSPTTVQLAWPPQAPQLNTPSSCQKRRGNMVLSNALNFSTISLDQIHQHQTQPLDRQCCSAPAKKRTFNFRIRFQNKHPKVPTKKIGDLTQRPHCPLHLSVWSNQYDVAMCLPNIPKGNYSCS